MKTYLNMINQILNEGIRKPNRTGIDTLSCFALPFRHDLADGFPLLTTKKMDGGLWNSLVHELLWFISGENHVRNLKEHTKIWDAWADDEGNLETAYGFYWRNFPYINEGKMVGINADNRENDSRSDWDGWYAHECGNFDQLGYCVEQLKTNPNSRRLVVSAWEPYNAHKSKLPPCHLLYIFNVQDGRLCLHMTQRSCDFGLGVPFNIASYALLTHIVAQEVGLLPGILSIVFVDAHVYIADKDDTTLVNGVPRCEYSHMGPLVQQLGRDPYLLPDLRIDKKSIWDLKFEDVHLLNYRHHDPIKMRVAV